MTIHITSRTTSKCEEFLKIKWPNKEYMTIDSFIEVYPNITEDELDLCQLWYRGVEKTYKEFMDNHIVFSEELKFLSFNYLKAIAEPNIRAALYFIKKTADCLQNARYFTVKSDLILDTDENVSWLGGYSPQFLLRCIYFGTASTWYSNTFDQLLQAVYWAFDLYTAVEDRDSNLYNDSWDVKTIMALCTYEFVVKELKSRGYTKVRKFLTSCSGKVEEVRTWANYIKHKGGIEYKYLEPADPIQFFLIPSQEKESKISIPPDDRFALKNFKSPIEVDIDNKIEVLESTHKALHQCTLNIIKEIDFDKYDLVFGGLK